MVLLIVVIAILQLLEIAPVASLRYAFFDLAQRTLPNPQPSVPITVVDIGDQSI